MPLSNLASMANLRREIAKFDRLIAENTARVPPTGPSSAAAGCRSVTLRAAKPLTRRPMPPPHCRRRTGNERRKRRRQTRRRDRLDGGCIGASSADTNRRIARTEEARSAGILGPSGGRNRLEPSSSDHSEDSSEETILKRNPYKKNGRQSMSIKLGHYDRNACLQNFSGKILKLCGVLREGRFRQAISTARYSDWGSRTDSAGCWQTVDSESHHHSAQSSVRQREPSRTFLCRTAKPAANERRIITKTLSRCLSFDVVGVPWRIVGLIRHHMARRFSGGVGHCSALRLRII